MLGTYKVAPSLVREKTSFTMLQISDASTVMFLALLVMGQTTTTVFLAQRQKNFTWENVLPPVQMDLPPLMDLPACLAQIQTVKFVAKQTLISVWLVMSDML